VINYFSSSKGADDCAQRVRQCGVKAITVQADVSKKSDIIKLFEVSKKEFGRVDIVMSNSGIEHFGAVDEVTEEDINRTFDINVKAQFFVAQQAYKHMENHGRVILMSSISAHKVCDLAIFALDCITEYSSHDRTGYSKACNLCRIESHSGYG
jgi:NAD(P)-dependent dehydrogenase (short-subunit alcohol dehydrogenase family)